MAEIVPFPAAANKRAMAALAVRIADFGSPSIQRCLSKRERELRESGVVEVTLRAELAEYEQSLRWWVARAEASCHAG